MDENLKPVFDEVYKTQIKPYLEDIEISRLKMAAKFKEKATAYCAIAIAVILFLPFGAEYKGYILPISVIIICFLTYALCFGTFPEDVKNRLLPVILKVFGNFQRTKIQAISFEEIKKYKIFPSATDCSNDDVIEGKYKNLDILIQESKLTHNSGGKNSHTVTDFDGLIIKVTSNKNFTGTTIVRPDSYSSSIRDLKQVHLEDPVFERIYNVYSTDQIEARYLLTTAFMMRLQHAGRVFSQNPNERHQTYCVFDKGHIFLFLSSSENFFEVFYPFKTVLNRKIYERVYEQMVAIFELIEELKLDQNIGM